MIFLVCGVAWWSVAHLFPAMFPGVRADIQARLGEGPYKGLFALDIIIALVLIVYGWKTAAPAAVYLPPLYGSPLPSLLMILAIVLFAASVVPNNLRRVIRHPQMTAVILWSAAHLMNNGDNRSLALFGGFAVWALLEIVFINKRDGEWQKPEKVSVLKDITLVVITAIAFAALVWLHPALFGVSARPAG